ncbi:fungal-specific transcription factor domain-containing protein [Emericellopsis atlantica]|uniref:Fungal-specific transcription factor domain-containing protein n=1 Tax=Emericellopsis atlantica TaxID=2614577 RepID=A0A9P7ZML7_9HYPO|nr:fungal-specific transcription factor domain-containing protein [Emericellopsis atlantica]KAG9254268.1 fungal-specific transcription factor domain-containing protein [Emericellopsis atlantica]
MKMAINTGLERSLGEPKKRVLGPLDKRKTQTRCQSCAQRKIKCQGPFPCAYCVRMKKPCRPPVQPESTSSVTFVAASAQTRAPDSSTLVTTSPLSIPHLDEQMSTIYMRYFASFMEGCHITGNSAATSALDLLPLMDVSPPLRNMALAIGALQSSRRASVRSAQRQDDPRVLAFRFYAEAIQALKHRLEEPHVAASDDVLWSTFLLGLFELLSETSGQPWATHMLYGTSRLFQLAGPSAVRVTDLRGRLFDAFCVLESKRALLFGDDTFLSRDEWLLARQDYDVLGAEASSPMSRLLPLMYNLASFTRRLFAEIEAIPEALRPFHPALGTLASEGISLLHELHLRIQDITISQAWQDDPSNGLAKSFLHAMLLFHCRNFTFYTCFDNLPIPFLSPEEVREHTSTALATCSRIAADETFSGIPGIMLLFPLRMVGVHASDRRTRLEVLRILARIYQLGFVVADRIRVDLEECWASQDDIQRLS